MSRHRFTFAVAGLTYTATFSRFADGRIGELFLNDHKSNAAADTNARDAAIAFSLAAQHDADAEAIRFALCRDSQGNASGRLGLVLDTIAKSSDAVRRHHTAIARPAHYTGPSVTSVTRLPSTSESW